MELAARSNTLSCRIFLMEILAQRPDSVPSKHLRCPTYEALFFYNILTRTTTWPSHIWYSKVTEGYHRIHNTISKSSPYRTNSWYKVYTSLLDLYEACCPINQKPHPIITCFVARFTPLKILCQISNLWSLEIWSSCQDIQNRKFNDGKWSCN